MHRLQNVKRGGNTGIVSSGEELWSPIAIAGVLRFQFLKFRVHNSSKAYV